MAGRVDLENNKNRLQIQQQQQEISESRKEEARAAALKAATLASRGIIGGVPLSSNDGRALALGGGMANLTMPKVTVVKKKKRGLRMKRSEKAENAIVDHNKTALKSSFDAIREEVKEEEDDMDDTSHSWTFAAPTATTAPTTEGDSPTSGGIHIAKQLETANEGSTVHSKPFKLSPRNIFQKKRRHEHQPTVYTTESHRKQVELQEQNQLALSQAKELLALGAWTCGVCGTPFASLESANSHELLCLVKWVKSESQLQSREKQHAVQQNGGRKRRILVLDSLDCRYENRPSAINAASFISALTTSLPPLSSSVTQRPSRNRMWSDDDVDSPPSPPRNLSVTPSVNLGNNAVARAAVAAAISNTTRCVVSFEPPRTGGEISLPSPMIRKFMVLTDDATVKIARRARHVMLALCRQKLAELPAGHSSEQKSKLLLLRREFEAQRELALASRDRHYYGLVEQRSLERSYGVQLPSYSNPYSFYYHRLNARLGMGDIELRPKRDKKSDASLPSVRIWGAVKQRFEHAYELVKEGPTTPADGLDQYDRNKHSDKSSRTDLNHDRNTLYINVVVKNSVQVVNNELQRMARGWWHSEWSKSNASDDKNGNAKPDMVDFQFEWIRAHTQKRVIQLAGIALSSDFTPRRVAVQLSNDLYRLMGPQLELRGVTIQTEIEYRVGQFFVLAVNVLQIDWILLMDYTTKQMARRRRRWIRDQGEKQSSALAVGNSDEKSGESKKRTLKELLVAAQHWFPSRNEVVMQVLTFMNRFHFIISLPLLHVFYKLFFKYAVNKYILAVVTDDIFRYVEKKGMEMQLEIKSNNDQAAAMLAILREMRGDDKKRKSGDEEGEGEDQLPVVGPLLGPTIKDDAAEAKPPADFSPPEALEFVGLEVDLPVGFKRLRWALLHSDSKFLEDAFFGPVMNYADITMGSWSKNNNDIGLPTAPEAVNEEDFLNATLEFSYLMPKSAFVKANSKSFDVLHNMH